MGSATLVNATPQSAMAESDKKTFKTLLKKPFQALFQKEKKKPKIVEEKETVKTTEIKKLQLKAPVDLLETFKKLQLENKRNETENNLNKENERNNFTCTTVDEERRSARIDSHSSQDSGFSETTTDITSDEEKEKDVSECFENLKISNKDGKKKKIQTVVISRGPIRNKVCDLVSVLPYSIGEKVDNTYRQINQVNRQTFSGGQVFVSGSQLVDNFSEIDRALTQVEINVQNFAHNSTQEQVDYFDLAQEFIQNEESCQKEDDFLIQLFDVQNIQDNINAIDSFIANEIPNPINELSSTRTDTVNLESGRYGDKNLLLTPPRSVTASSPMSDSQTSYYPSNSEYTMSPERSSPINSDYEKYQDLTHFNDYPSCVVELEKEICADIKSRERKSSNSSMTMKLFKDMQKELSNKFSKMECCQLNRKPCKAIFEAHMKKLKIEERKSLCLKVAKLDIETAYGVLHHILLSLSKNANDEDFQYALFSLICERILAEKPSMFLEDTGLGLIKSAVLRCYQRPLLTRYLVQCVRAALRIHPTQREHIFHETDALGDNLVVACARAGDACGAVLGELVAQRPPLFDVHHNNAEGYTALHVACSEHSAASPRLHIVHVLLDHAAADLWKGDVKGGDTALHLAVNSTHCDLKLIMILFKHVDRKMWKQLAHAQNRSSVTPLEYARTAAKSTTRPNYPHEVLDFLKKCR